LLGAGGGKTMMKHTGQATSSAAICAYRNLSVRAGR